MFQAMKELFVFSVHLNNLMIKPSSPIGFIGLDLNSTHIQQTARINSNHIFFNSLKPYFRIFK